MKIELTYSQLADVASLAVDNLTTVEESGYVRVNHSELKSLAKILLWMYTQPENFTDDLPEGISLEDLYFQLEENGDLIVDKKDLPKYKYYMEMVYAHVSNIEDQNKQLQMETLLKMTNSLGGMAEAFENIGDAIANLSVDAIEEKASKVAEFLKNFEQ